MLSCTTNSTELESPLNIQGRVIDSNGDPIENAIIEISYYYDIQGINKEALLSKTGKSNFIISIMYSNYQLGHVKLWITRFKSPDTVVVLVDTIKAAGNHTISFPGRNSMGQIMKSDVYEYHIQTSTYNKSIAIIVFIDDYSQFENIKELECYAKTNADGKFEINKDVLASNIDTLFSYTNETGEKIGKLKISKYIKLWALHEQYNASYKDSINIEYDDVTKIELYMDEK